MIAELASIERAWGLAAKSEELRGRNCVCDSTLVSSLFE